MARLESLPFDIVHLIVAYLATYDLPSVALVCRSLNAAATPRIYSHVRYTQALVKQWGKILSPLELLCTRFDLRTHLKSLDIRAVPLHKGAPNPLFTRTCRHVLANTPALVSFSWATSGLFDTFLASLLHILAPQSDTASSRTIRHHAQDGQIVRPPLARLTLTEDGLSTSDAMALTHLGPVEHIALHKPSTGATRALVEWLPTNPRLASLTISHTYSLDPPLLRRIISYSPHLKSLSINHCLHLAPSVLFAIIDNLELESLAFSIPRDTECHTFSATFPSLPTLRHLSLTIDPPDEPIPDRHANAPADPLTQHLFRHILKAIRTVNLYSLTLRLASHRALGHKLLNALIVTQGATLCRLNLFKIVIPAQGMADVLRHVSNLEQLSLELGGVLDDLDLIIEALPSAQHLTTLIDTSPTISTTTSRRPASAKATPRSRALTRVQATQLLEAGPVLGNVVSQGRNWVKEYVWTSGRIEVGVSMRKVRAPQ